MRIAELVCLLGFVTLLHTEVPVRAQVSGSISRVGILIADSGRSESQVIKGLREQLSELDYKDRKNILFEIRDAKGDRAALQPLAAALMTQRVNVVCTTGTRATRTAKEIVRDIPIVFSHPADPVALGLVKSMTHPGKTITGVAGLSSEMMEPRLKAFKEIVPDLRRVHIFYDTNNEFSQSNFAAAERAAVNLGLDVLAHPVKSANELKTSLGALQKRQGDALFHVPDDLVETAADFIFEVARQKSLPTMFNDETWAIQGALAAYGPSYYHMGRQAGRLVDKILKGQKPGTLPVERASKFDLVINYRTSRFIDLTISPAILKKADKVIR